MLPARHVRILGPTDLRWDGVSVPLGGGKARALVAALALAPDQVVTRDHLAEVLWGEQAREAQGSRLDVRVSRARRALREGGADPGLIETASRGYRLRLGPESVDAFVAEAQLGRARDDLAAGRVRAAREGLMATRALWRGQALADLPDDPDRARLDELLRAVEEELAEARLALGEGRALVSELEGVATRNPLRERVHAQLIRALHDAGRDVEALRVYDGLRTRLSQELGIDPPAELRALHERILRQELPAAETTVPVARRRSRVLPAAVVAALVIAGTVFGLEHGGDGQAPRLAAALSSDGLVLLDPEDGHLLAQGPVAGRTANEATGYVLLAQGSAWALAETGTVTQMDPATGRVLHTYPLAKDAAGMVAARGDVWVALDNAAYLVRIDPATATTVEIPLGRLSHGAMTGAGGVAFGAGALWVTRGHAEVDRVDPALGRVVGRTGVPGATSIVYGAGGVWAADADGGVVFRLDPTSGSITSRVTLPPRVCCLAAGPDSIFAASEAPGLVSRISPAGRVLDTFRVTGTAGDLAYAAGRLWVSGLTTGLITSIDVASGRKTVVRPGGAVAAVAADGRRVAVAVNVDSASLLARVHGPTARVLMPSNLIADVDPATPGVYGAGPFDRMILRATCAGLFTWPDLPSPAGAHVIPELSRDDGSVSRDGRTWTFTIRRGFRFSPPAGREVTAATVAHTLERAVAPELGRAAPASRLLAHVRGLRAFRLGRTPQLAGIEAGGDRLRINLDAPVPELPRRLASPVFCVVPDQTPPRRNGVSEPLPSAGPYYVGPGAGIEILLRNPGYHGRRPHGFAAFRIDFGLSETDSLARVQAGRADLAMTDEPRPGFALTPLLATDVLRVRGAPGRDPSLRRSIGAALDRRALARLTGGLPTVRLLPPGLGAAGSPPLPPSPPPSTATARALSIDDCGGRCRALAGEVQHELERFGFRVRRSTHTPDLVFDRIEALDPDPADFLAAALGGSGGKALNIALTRAGEARDAAARALDARLARDPGAAIAFATPIVAEARSRRLGCVHTDPYAPGIDLAALCLQKSRR